MLKKMPKVNYVVEMPLGQLCSDMSFFRGSADFRGYDNKETHAPQTAMWCLGIFAFPLNLN